MCELGRGRSVVCFLGTLSWYPNVGSRWGTSIMGLKAMRKISGGECVPLEDSSFDLAVLVLDHAESLEYVLLIYLQTSEGIACR